MVFRTKARFFLDSSFLQSRRHVREKFVAFDSRTLSSSSSSSSGFCSRRMEPPSQRKEKRCAGRFNRVDDDDAGAVGEIFILRKAFSGLKIGKRHGRIEEPGFASKYALRRSLHISVLHIAFAHSTVYMGKHTWDGSPPREKSYLSGMMGMNKKCVRNNEVDLWILREDGRRSNL